MIQSVPRSKHTVSIIETVQLLLLREIIPVCAEILKWTEIHRVGITWDFLYLQTSGT